MAKSEAVETAAPAAETVRIKIPIDPNNPKDLIVPVTINGIRKEYTRGVYVEVPPVVEEILEGAGYL